MGMSASQSRLLSLTARLSDLEYQAQVISNSKLRLADLSEQAASKYSDALNKQKLSIVTGVNSTTGTTTYADATAYLLTTYNAISNTEKQRLLKDNTGRLIVSAAVVNAYENAETTDLGNIIKTAGGKTLTTSQQLQENYTNVTEFLNAKLGYSTQAEAVAADLTYDKEKVNYYTNCYSGTEGFLKNFKYTSNPANIDPTLTNDNVATSWYKNMMTEISKHGYNSPTEENMNSGEWLYQQLNNGNLYLELWNSSGGEDGNGGFDSVAWSSGDPSLQTQIDDSDLDKAEAEYKITSSQLESKDKKLDLSLTAINTQHKAVETEMDSVKKVIEKNVDRSFKVFSA